jgi:hypothetical protein
MDNLDSSFDMLVGNTDDLRVPHEPETDMADEPLGSALSDDSNLSEAFDFISSVGDLPEPSNDT